MTKILNKLKLYWPLIILTIFFSLFYLVFINLFNSDIGRHIANGREIFGSFTLNSSFQQLNLSSFYSESNFKAVLTTNYYSYTQTNFANINHHWFFGVVAYLVHQVGGFKLLTWFNLFLNTVGFIFILLTALNSTENSTCKKSKFNVAVVAITAFFIMPLITNRNEIRPESFSLLFLSIYYYLFTLINLNMVKHSKFLPLFIKKNKNKLLFNKKWLWVLLITLQIIWVNTHLFFIFGPLLAGFFLFETVLTLLLKKTNLKIQTSSKKIESKKPQFLIINITILKNIFKNKTVKFWFVMCVSLFLVSLINPHGLNGLLAPFNIFNNYAYKVAENQSTFFLIDYGLQKTLNIFIVFSSFFVLLLGVISLFNINLTELKNKSFSPMLVKINLKPNYIKNFLQLLLLTIFVVLANKISRMTPFLGIFMIPYLSKIISEFAGMFSKKCNWNMHLTNLTKSEHLPQSRSIKCMPQKYKSKQQKEQKLTSQLCKINFNNNIFIMFFSTISFILFIFILKLNIFMPNISNLGTGELPNSYSASKFITNNNLKGPIFNNYDVGGYLAYNIFPQEKLFIDNRPEAYSQGFLENEFLASLKNETVWKNIEQKYNLNIIFFNRHDQIDGAQEFLFNRVKDETWVPVFVDNFVIIFVKNVKTNQTVIDKFKISQSVFGLK